MRFLDKIIGWVSNRLADRPLTRLDVVTLQHFLEVDGELIPRAMIMPPDWRPIREARPETSIEALARLVS